MNFQDYVKAAFKNHYNLLVLGGGLAFAVLSTLVGAAFFPIIALLTAAEITYLMTLSSNPRFQRVIRSRINAVQEEAFRDESNRKLNGILSSLNFADRTRFETIRNKCDSLTSSIEGLGEATIDQSSDVDRLLWIYLKLLAAKQTVSSFLSGVKDIDLTKEVKKLEGRLSNVLGDDPISSQKRATINDMLITAIKRVENFQSTKGNLEIIELKIEQIESKLNILAEMAINRHDSSSITGGVDAIVRDVEMSESTIDDLKVATGVCLNFEEAPRILRARVLN